MQEHIVNTTKVQLGEPKYFTGVIDKSMGERLLR